MSHFFETHRELSESVDISFIQNSTYFVMNQRPFISSNLNIYDETRCVFSSSVIGGQPVLISQEQNRKICDTTMTSISSNQHPIGNCCYPTPQQTPAPNQSWPCTLQAHKQGVPQGVMFNFPQPNYTVPLSCVPTTYIPPPPPAPQIVECCHKTPQSVCTDFRKYGLEAMMYQEKLRKQCLSFSYDKKVGTSDHGFYPKNNLCCCGTQSTTLNVDQKEEQSSRVEETDCKQNLKVNPCNRDPQNRKECICFVESNLDDFGRAKTGIEGKEENTRKYGMVDATNKKLNSKENVCYDYQDKPISRTDSPRSTCLKKYGTCSKENENPKKCVSFDFFDSTLIMSEKKENQGHKSNATRTDFSNKETFLYRDVCITKHVTGDDFSKDRYHCDIIRQITHLKRKRKGLIRMYAFFNDNLEDSLQKIDNEIRDLKKIIQGGSFKKANQSPLNCSGISKLGEDWEEIVSSNFKPYQDYFKIVEPEDSHKEKVTPQMHDLFSPSTSQNRLQEREDQSKKSGNERVMTSGKIYLDEKIENSMNIDAKQHTKNKKSKETTEDEKEHKRDNPKNEDSQQFQGKINVNEKVKNENELMKNENITHDIKIILKEMEKAVFDSVNEISSLPSEDTEKDDNRSTANYSVAEFKEDNNSPANTNKQQISESGVEKNEIIGLKKNVTEEQNSAVKLISSSARREDSYQKKERKTEIETPSEKNNPETNINSVHFEKIDDKKNQVVETKDDVVRGENFEQNAASCSVSCDAKYPQEKSNTGKPDIKNFEVPLVFYPCTCGRDFVSKCRIVLYNLFTELIERMKDIWQNFNIRPSQPCMSTRPDNIFYRERNLTHFHSSRKICHERLGTNRFCGKTCYNADLNEWYSCCSQSDEHVVQITFRETAERKFVLLKNSCRNSRFHVVYE